MIKTASRILAVMAALIMTAFTASARPDEQTSTERADSLNRAVAVVMAGSLNPIITNLANTDLPIDRAEIGRYIAQLLAGADFGMTSAQANQYVENVLSESTRLSVESQQAFLAEAAAQPGAIVTPSGLVFQVITEGEGVFPAMNDTVDVRYVGRYSDGSVFDDTGSEYVTFDVGNEIPGFNEGLMMMKPGGTYRIVIPADLAYGAEGIPGILPGNAALDFTVTIEAVHPAK